MKYIILLFCFFVIQFSSPLQAGEIEFNDKIKAALEDYKKEDYTSAFIKFYEEHENGNLIGTHYLGVIYYFGLGVEKNFDASTSFFYEASKNGEEGGYPESAYWLARNSYLNKDSKYFNERQGLRLLFILEENNHKEGAFLAGNYLLSMLEGSDDFEKTLNLAYESMNKAASLGKVEAHFFKFLIQKEKVDKGLINELDEKIFKDLHIASVSPNQNQIDASYLMAALYKEGNYVSEDLSKYIEYLEYSVEAGNFKASIELGRAFQVGMIKSPDYSAARFYYDYAKKHGVVGADLAINGLNAQEDKETNIGSFNPPQDWYLNFLASEAFINGFTKTSPSVSTSPNVYTNQSSSINGMTRFTSVGNTMFSSNGVTYRQVGNTIRSSSGESYRISGKSISGSNGINYRISGNNIRRSDGVNYRVVGKNIYGSNGTSCRISGSTTRCY